MQPFNPYQPHSTEPFWVDLKALGAIFGWDRSTTAQMLCDMKLRQEDGRPIDKAVDNGIAQWQCPRGRKNKVWLWRADLLVPAMEEVGIKALPPIQQTALHYVARAVRAMNQAASLQAAGQQKSAHQAITRAAIILVSAIDFKKDAQEGLLMRAMDAYMERAGVEDTLRLIVLNGAGYDGSLIMSETAQNKLQEHTPSADAQCANRRL